ncbi:MAG: DUF5683 domain-containing protein [Muribaculaceae bacterium]
MLAVPALLSAPLPSQAQEPAEPGLSVDTTIVTTTIRLEPAAADTTSVLGSDSLPVARPFDKWAGYNLWEERETTFSPDPTRAVWMSALFPGLGQIYNRRYWKLPIIVGGYLGLGYATSWNNNMLKDYQQAYLDIMDNDPSTNSYMNFFPPNTVESNLDRAWLERLLRSRKNFYRRNRDLCIICMVGVYALAMVDAYVDASLSHFDISPDLSIDWSPAVIPDQRGKMPGIGLNWALNF